jgi:P27 family predicted phage terminase small subunit
VTRGRLRKPQGRAQGHRRHVRDDEKVAPGFAVEVHDGGGRAEVIPLPPEGMLTKTRARWVKFWRSELSRIVDEERDRPALERLFTLYDERERAYRDFRKRRLVKGSTKQLVVNPLWRHATSTLDPEIRQLEDRFGLTPRSRAQLGLAIGGLKKTLDDLNRELDDDTDRPEAADPRLALEQ